MFTCMGILGPVNVAININHENGYNISTPLWQLFFVATTLK